MELPLTIDTQILVFGSDSASASCYQTFMALLESRDSVKLVVDAGGKMVQEYSNKMAHGRRGMELVRLLATRGRIQRVDVSPLRRPIQNYLLDKLHFDPDDLIFVATAIATPSKCLITEESGYRREVRKYLKKKEDICVHSADDACQIIRANPICECVSSCSPSKT